MSETPIARNLFVGEKAACDLRRAEDPARRPAIVHLDDMCGVKDGPLDLFVPIPDDENDGPAMLEPLLPYIFTFIDANRANRPVLVHCTAGASRSPTVALLFLLHVDEIEAVSDFRARHPGIPTNPGFKGMLFNAENAAWDARKKKAWKGED